MAQLYSNNAKSTLNGAIASGTLSITLNTGDGAKFPSPTGGDFFLFTLYQVVNGFEANWEIVSCTGRAGDVLTLGARGLENTTPFAFNNGDFVELRFTAGDAGSLAPKVNAVLTSPTLAATPAGGDNSLNVADTAFVAAAIAAAVANVAIKFSTVTGAVNAVAGGAYDFNTSAAMPAAQLTLPASPAVNTMVCFHDYAGTFAVNNLTIVPNGNPFMGLAATAVTCSTNNYPGALIYRDAIQGWVLL